MKDVKRAFDLLTESEREAALKNIIGFYLSDRGEEIGVVAAGEILDVTLESVTPKIYNRAVEDTKEAFKQHAADFEFALGVLKK